MSASISRFRIFAADDNHPIARQGIAGVVGVQPDVVLAGETSNGGRSNRQLRTHQGRNAFRRERLLRFDLAPRETLAATLSCYIAGRGVILGKPGLCPRSEQAHHPVHTFRLADARWFRNR